MNKSFFYIVIVSALVSPSNAKAIDSYIGGVPVDYYYGHPVPDMFGIAGAEFDAAIADIKDGVRDWSVDDLRDFERGGKITVPVWFPDPAKHFEKLMGTWGHIIKWVFFIRGDQQGVPEMSEFSKQDIPVELSGEEEPYYIGNRDIDPGGLKPDYTGDFGADFGGDYSGTS